VLHSRAVTNNLTQKNGNKNNLRKIYLLYQQVKQRINETFPFVDDCKGTDKKLYKLTQKKVSESSETFSK
jgi:hypothetical protein